MHNVDIFFAFLSFNPCGHNVTKHRRVMLILECPRGRWGVGCEEICHCQHSSNCDPVTGQCVCLPGWFGPDCSHGNTHTHTHIHKHARIHSFVAHF